MSDFLKLMPFHLLTDKHSNCLPSACSVTPFTPMAPTTKSGVILVQTLEIGAHGWTRTTQARTGRAGCDPRATSLRRVRIQTAATPTFETTSGLRCFVKAGPFLAEGSQPQNQTG